MHVVCILATCALGAVGGAHRVVDRDGAGICVLIFLINFTRVDVLLVGKIKGGM